MEKIGGIGIETIKIIINYDEKERQKENNTVAEVLEYNSAEPTCIKGFVHILLK